MIIVQIPQLGIKTFAKDEDDVLVATVEAITCFGIAAERFGLGIKEEIALVELEGNGTRL